jgi:hypothetical protein
MIKSAIKIMKVNDDNNNMKEKNMISKYINIYLAKKKENDDVNYNNNDINNYNFNFFYTNNLYILLDIKDIYINIRNFDIVLNEEYNNYDNFNNNNNDDAYFVKFFFVKSSDINRIKVFIIFNEDYYSNFIEENNDNIDENDNDNNNKFPIRNNEFIKSIIVI